MIISKLYGGLGNQLFQWAASNTVANKYNTKCYYDISHFLSTDFSIEPSTGPDHRVFELNRLNLDLKLILGNMHQLPMMGDNYHFRPNYQIPNNCYMNGFWQSEKYFIENQANIRKQLKLNEKKRDNLLKLYPFLKDETVSLHIRRGDYLRLELHPCQPLDYYHDAINLIGANNMNLLVLSDDITWCKENFKYNNTFFAENQSNVTDLYTMSLCSHNIIANSSFSWWGAWLNENKNKKVIAPKNWFTSDAYTGDHVPENWIRI